MNIAIVEDLDSDFFVLNNIVFQSELYKKLDITVSRYRNGEDFLAHFHADKYQLLFLDVLLTGTMTGMDVAREVRKMTKTLPIVFTTSEKSYALEGYEVQALDYLVKPYQVARVNAVLQRIFLSGTVKAYLTVQVEREKVRFPIEELIWAEADNHAIEINLTNHRLLRTYMKFERFCAMLPQNADFYSCSRGVIVNMKYVDYFEKGDFVLTNGKKIPVSRSKKNEMKSAFNEYQIRITRGGGIL